MAVTHLVVAVREPNLDGGTTTRSELAHLVLRFLQGPCGPGFGGMFVDTPGLAQPDDADQVPDDIRGTDPLASCRQT